MQEGVRVKLGICGMIWCCILMVAFMVGCAQTKQVTEITLIHGWGSTEDDHVSMRQIYQDFQKENPDIRIHLVSLPTTDALIRKVQDSVMVGEIPDIIFLAGEGRESLYQYMVDYRYALDLMPYIQADAEFRSNLAPENLEYWTTADNRIFTVSDVVMMSGGYWYNEEIFDKAGVVQPPKTWKEFEAACEKIEDWAEKEQNGIKALQLSHEGYLYFAGHILAQKGMEDVKGKVQIGPEKMTEMLSMLERIHKHSVSDGGNYNYRDETDLFNAGKLGIYVNGVWGASMISPEMRVAYAQLPGDPTSVFCESAGIGYMIGRTGDSAREEACVRFLKYMLSPKVQERILLETQQLPANPKIRIEDFADQMPRFCQAVEAVQDANLKIEIPEQLWSRQQFALFQENIIPVLSGTMDKQTLVELLASY